MQLAPCVTWAASSPKYRLQFLLSQHLVPLQEEASLGNLKFSLLVQPVLLLLLLRLLHELLVLALDLPLLEGLVLLDSAKGHRVLRLLDLVPLEVAATLTDWGLLLLLPVLGFGLECDLPVVLIG